MLEVLSTGFLGSRADLLSDVLMLALLLIVPALIAAVWAARAERRRLHRALMWTVVSVVVGYVIVYEASMLAQGGLAFLRARIRMPEATYFAVVAAHVLVAVCSLVTAVLAVRRGSALFASVGADDRAELRPRHSRIGYTAFALLAASAASGVLVYYLTFVYVAA